MDVMGDPAATDSSPGPSPSTSPGPQPSLRAGDAERQRTADRLADAFQEGRLDVDEFGSRIERVWQATHDTDLDALLADLPADQGIASGRLPVPATRRLPARTGHGATAGVPATVAIMSGAERSGEWAAAGTHTAVAIMGGVSIDLREASFTEAETTIIAVAIMGGVEVIVPPDVRVRVHGLPLMGGFGAEGSINPADLAPDAPLVTITGAAFWGGVGVVRRDFDED